MEFFILSILQSFVFLQAAQLFNGCVKNLSDPVSKHQRGTVLLLFNRNDGSGGDADQTGKLLLGQTRGCPQFFYLGSDFPTSLRNMKYASCEVNFILSQPRRFVNKKNVLSFHKPPVLQFGNSSRLLYKRMSVCYTELAITRL